jgi:hypothetical protein
MKIKMGKPVCVYQGDAPEKLHWGFVQFPWLYNTADGDILLSIHCEDDAPFAIDGGKMYFKTSDGGKSWRVADASDVKRMGYRTAQGDMLMPRAFPAKSVKRMKRPTWFGNYRIPTDDVLPKPSSDPDSLPFPAAISTNVFGSFDYLYYVDSLPDSICPKGLLFSRLKQGESEPREFIADADWKHRLVRIYDPQVVYDSWKGEDNELIVSSPGLYSGPRIKLGPDGKTLWLAEYKEGTDPETGVYSGKGGSYILNSTDNGESWRCVSYIRYEGDADKDHFAYMRDGFSEPSIEFMGDGSMLCLLRTCGVFGGTPEWGPTYLARSTDGGKSWSKPQYFKDRGALPQLLRLECGATLAVITRPGIFVYGSDDEGYTWDCELEVMTDCDRSALGNTVPERPNFWEYAGSCCNCTILPIAENKALLAYSDFYYPDENGVKRKSILTVEITVEM